MEPTKVFLSYSHDNPELMQRVLTLANALRQRGVDADVDRYYQDPPQGWPRWCEEQLRPEVSRFVLVVCTRAYLARVQGLVPADEGRGVYWEGQIIYNYIYAAKLNARFLPVLFDDEPHESVPIPIYGRTAYRLRGFDLDDSGFEALYRLLTDQPPVVKPELGEVQTLGATPVGALPANSRTRVEPPLAAREVKADLKPPAPQPPDLFEIDRLNAPSQLIGREAEMAAIEAAWQKGGQVLTFVALGGEGKTSLVATWARGLEARGWAGCETAFAWSFYRQGSSEQAGASSDLFFARALEFFGLPILEGESGPDKGRRLAGRLGAKRALLILDGLEPLQYPPTSPRKGELKDEALRALLRRLAGHSAGFCLVTTRYRIADLEGFAAAPRRDLPGLSDEAGAALLRSLGVTGPAAELRQLSIDVSGHPLTLEVLGAYLKEAHGGDVFRRDCVDLGDANDEEKNGRAFRAMEAYAHWLAADGPKGARALALLRLTGLFDRALNAGCLGALLAKPAIAGLTEALVDLGEAARNIALSRLEAAKLVSLRWDAGRVSEIDAHPLLRAYFERDLRTTQPEAGREAHRRLYTHLTTTTPDKEKPTLDDLQPLYQAVAHGCAAGLWQETCDEVYDKRICRGAEFYSTKKLGAFGADLGAVASFFDAPWRRVSPGLTAPFQAWLLGEAGFRLCALGRLGEAREPMRTGLEMYVAQENWDNAARAAGNLSELALTLGQIAEAIRLGETAVAHADRSGDAFQQLSRRTMEADARHQAGQRAEAEALFVEAERRQAEWQPQYPRLYSLPGYQYRDWRLAPVERAVWRRLTRLTPSEDGAGLSLLARRADTFALVDEAAFVSHLEEVLDRGHKMFEWRASSDSLLDIGLDHLTLARAALYAAALRGEPPTDEHVQDAVDFVRRAGQLQYLPPPLLTRALYRALVADFPGAQDDLDEAYEIAQRGPMKLYLADIHLHRARLFGLIAHRPPGYPWQSPQADLGAARALIVACGYNRRLPELEDAEAALTAMAVGA